MASTADASNAAAPPSTAFASPLAPLARADALSELEVEYERLAIIPQGRRCPDSAARLRRAADYRYLRHPERDVRLAAARCLAEGLRIFAPEPPLAKEDLRTFIEVFFEQIAALHEVVGAAFVHIVGLIEQLVEVRAFMLIFDCECVEDLVTSLVDACIMGVRAKDGNGLDGLLAEVLLGVLVEADEVPAAALSRLVRTLATRDGNGGGGQACAAMARRVLEGLAHRSAAIFINEFLADLMRYPSAAAAPADEWEEESPDCLDDDAVRAIIFELFAIDTALVVRVLPNLFADLRSEDEKRRAGATELVGRMLAHFPVDVLDRPTRSGGGAKPRQSLIELQPLVVDHFLERLMDTDEAVRLVAVEGTGGLLHVAARCGCGSVADGGDLDGKGAAVAGLAALASAAVKARAGLAERSLDAALAVRLRVVEVAAELAGSEAGVELMAPVLPEILRRILDRKPLVRDACIDALGTIYRQHGLPAAVTRNWEAVEKLAWIPQLLCEAFPVFAGGRLGHTAQLEECIERCGLGCGDAMAASERALALVAFCGSALDHSGAAAGLTQLLGRKCAANAALRHFVEMRLAKGSPLLVVEDSNAIVAFQPDANQEKTTPSFSTAMGLVERLARVGPAAEDRTGLPAQAVEWQMRKLDSVRDKALWTHLDKLLGGCGASADVAPLATDDLPPVLAELGRLLRIHQLAELGPLLRRCLLVTWLLPDQAEALVALWPGADAREPTAFVSPSCRDSARALTVEISKHFPRAFAAQVPELIGRLSGGDAAIAFGALRVLAVLGKHVTRENIRLPPVDAQELAGALVKALAEASAEDSAWFRRAVRALGLLEEVGRGSAVKALLMWAQDRVRSVGSPDATGAGLQLAAAAFAVAPPANRDMTQALTSVAASDGDAAEAQEAGASCMTQATCPEAWVVDARVALRTLGRTNRAVGTASAELFAVVGLESDIMDLLETGSPELAYSAAVAALRAIRRARLPLGAELLAAIAARVRAFVAELGVESSNSVADLAAKVAVLEGELQKCGRSTAYGGGTSVGSTSMRAIDRLRICSTLPCMWAFAPSRRCEAPRQLLRATLAQTLRQGVARGEPLLEVAVACFLHFLSCLDSFLAEAAADMSAFPESSRIADFFVAALSEVSSAQGAELAQVAIRVAGHARFFVDRGSALGTREPSAPSAEESMDKAAAVLRHVAERHCKELGVANLGPWQPGAAERISMPSELFKPRPGVHFAPSVLPSTQPISFAAPSLPLARGRVGADRDVSSGAAMVAVSPDFVAADVQVRPPLPPATSPSRPAATVATTQVAHGVQEIQSLLSRGAVAASLATPPKPNSLPKLFRGLGDSRRSAAKMSKAVGGDAAEVTKPAGGAGAGSSPPHAGVVPAPAGGATTSNYSTARRSDAMYLTPKKRCSAKALARLASVASAASPATSAASASPGTSIAASPASSVASKVGVAHQSGDGAKRRRVNIT